MDLDFLKLETLQTFLLPIEQQSLENNATLVLSDFPPLIVKVAMLGQLVSLTEIKLL